MVRAGSTINRPYEVLEPDARKRARPVLRGGRRRKASFLPDRPKTITLPDQTRIDYRYRGHYLNEVQRGNYVHRYIDYDLAGNLRLAQLIGQAGELKMAYDLLSRPTAQSTAFWQEENLLYDPVGNLLSRHVKDKEGRTTLSYTYDDLNQLTAETGQKAHHYQYDSLHNRLVKDEQNYTVNSLNQLSDDSEKTYTYDQNGNRKTSSGTSYHYDALDRLTAIVEGTQRIEYTYDDLNRRLSKQAFEKNGNEWRPISTLQYLYIGQNEVGAYQDGRCLELRILGSGKGAEIGAAVVIELGNKTYAPVHDSTGNVTCLIDADTGKVEETYRYTAYGEHLFTPTKNPWLFASKRHDPETNLVYFGRRYYDSVTGSWLTPDPSGFDDGSNLYAYVHNNPLTHIDLYGLESMASANLDWQRDAHLEARKRDAMAHVGVKVGGISDFAQGARHGAYSGFFHPVDTGMKFATMVGEQEMGVEWTLRPYQSERSLAYHMGESLGEVAGFVGTFLPLSLACKAPEYVSRVTGALSARLAGSNWVKNIAGYKPINATKQGANEIFKYTKSNPRLGQQMHKSYKKDSVTADMIKEFRLPSGKRIDFLDIKNGRIYELKPFNPQAIKLGQKQLQNYKRELETIPKFKGIEWNTILETY